MFDAWNLGDWISSLAVSLGVFVSVVAVGLGLAVGAIRLFGTPIGAAESTGSQTVPAKAAPPTRAAA